MPRASVRDPTPNAIIRLQRLRDNTSLCDYGLSATPSDFWPNTLFDPREGLQRDINPVNRWCISAE